MVIALGNCDMVLGVQLLRTLGPIPWVSKSDLNGIHQGSVCESKAYEIIKIKDSEPHLSMIYVMNLVKRWKYSYVLLKQ